MVVEQPEKTANTLWHHHWFPCEMTSEKWAQKFHTDDVASDWPNHMGNLLQPIRSTTQIWIVTRQPFRISALVSQTSFRGETSGGVAKCRMFSQASMAGAGCCLFFFLVSFYRACKRNTQRGEKASSPFLPSRAFDISPFVLKKWCLLPREK